MNQIKSREDFRKWAKIRMIDLNTNQAKLAAQLGTVAPRISDAMRGHPNGRKYLVPLILALGGKPEDFREIVDGTFPTSKGA